MEIKGALLVNKRLLEARGDVGNGLSLFVINMAEKTIYVNTYQNADAFILVNVQIFSLEILFYQRDDKRYGQGAIKWYCISLRYLIAVNVNFQKVHQFVFVSYAMHNFLLWVLLHRTG